MAEAVPVFHHHLQVGEPCLMDTAFPSRVTSTNSPTLPQQSRSFGYSYVLEHLKHPQGAMQDAMSFPVQEAIPLELHNSTRRRKKLQRPYFDNYIHTYMCELHHSRCSQEQCKNVLCMHYAQSKERQPGKSLLQLLAWMWREQGGGGTSLEKMQ